MAEGNMIYRVSDKPKRVSEWIGYIAQYFFCVLPSHKFYLF